MLQHTKEYLATIEGVGAYPLFSLLLFTGFFAGLIWWTLTFKKTKIQKLKNIPFED